MFFFSAHSNLFAFQVTNPCLWALVLWKKTKNCWCENPKFSSAFFLRKTKRMGIRKQNTWKPFSHWILLLWHVHDKSNFLTQIRWESTTEEISVKWIFLIKPWNSYVSSFTQHTNRFFFHDICFWYRQSATWRDKFAWCKLPTKTSFILILWCTK